MNIYEKLLNIQSQLKAPKSQYNNFGKYSYRSCEDILEGLKPLLKENKATLTINDEIVQIGDRYYVRAIATLWIEEGDSISATAYAREDETKKGMDLAQITGSTSSYARKYALNGLFAIDDTKDSDATNMHGKEGQQPKAANREKGQTLHCSGCGTQIDSRVANYSNKKYGRLLCMSCQKKVK
jgi:hypothetical protein|nr:MAG TPA: ERF superfamily protein [Caudoviricetes sp.]